MAAHFSPPPPSIIAIVSVQLLHERYFKLNEHSIQGIYFQIHGLKLPNPNGAPNANRWHTSPNLPPQTISMQTKKSTSFPLLSSFTFLHKVWYETICTAHKSMPILPTNSSSSQDFVSMTDHIDDFLHQWTPLVMLYLQDMVVHHIFAIGCDVIEVHRTSTSCR
jgi:hypothetical protein